jgi:hypothetical protein
MSLFNDAIKHLNLDVLDKAIEFMNHEGNLNTYSMGKLMKLSTIINLLDERLN